MEGEPTSAPGGTPAAAENPTAPASLPRNVVEAEAAVRRAHPPRPITNRSGHPPATRSWDPGVSVETGEEILAFHLGSTIILLSEPGGYRWDAGPPGTDVVLGMPSGRPIRDPD